MRKSELNNSLVLTVISMTVMITEEVIRILGGYSIISLMYTVSQALWQ